MSWIDAAILSPAIFGVASIFESHILSKRVPSLQSFLLIGGILALIGAFILLNLFPLPEGMSVGALLVALVPGILRSTGVTFMFNTMRREEVSQIVSVAFTYPVFVAIMAVPLLREILSYQQWLAIIIVVAGAVMVSLKKSSSGSTSWLGKVLLLLLGVSLLYALADVVSKYALAYFSSWNMLALNHFGFALVWLAVSTRPRFLREVGSIRRQRLTMLLILASQTLGPAGMALLLWAMERGPVSLVSTIAGSRPIFVAVYALVVSRLFPGFLMRTPAGGMLVLRLVATAMIVGGISIIYLT